LDVLRQAENEAIFRRVNERIAELGGAWLSEAEDSFEILCECSTIDCTERMRIGREIYRAGRENDRRFFVLPEHVNEQIEVVVSEGHGFVVVEKQRVAGVVAEREAD
jgi:hypothetical protein